MQFEENLKAAKEVDGAEPETFFPERSKRAINELLFEIMPPKTTIQELEHLAVAIFATVQSAWSQ